MSKSLFCLLLVYLGFTDGATAQEEVYHTNLSNFHLVWSDEFDKDGRPDTLNWKFENGFIRNHELQWYQPQNAFCKDGFCIIEGKREEFPNPNFLAGSADWRFSRPSISYTSASMNTRGRHSWKYGKFVMRAKIDADDGLWPAFWTLGDNKQWPTCGEIDIMEYYHEKLLANIIIGTGMPYKAIYKSSAKSIKDFGIGWSNSFHTWEMDWDEKGIKIFVDGLLLKEELMQDIVNQDNSRVNPFMQQHYILLDLAIGGDNGGDPSITVFPKRLTIDYVRVYQQNTN